VLVECEALINPGLTVRCDECRIFLVPFNELCERCKVAVEGQARDTLMKYTSQNNFQNILGLPELIAYIGWILSGIWTTVQSALAHPHGSEGEEKREFEGGPIQQGS